MLNFKKSVLELCQNLVSGGSDKFIGHDFITSRGKKEQNSGAVTVSLKETISDNQRVESDDNRPVILNSHCSSASTSTVSSNATSANNGVFHGENLRFRGKLVKAEHNCWVQNIHLKKG